MSDIINKITNIKSLYQNVKKYTGEINKYDNTILKINIDNIFLQLNTYCKKDIHALNTCEIFKLWNMLNEIIHIIKSTLVDLENTTNTYNKNIIDNITENDIENMNNSYGNMIVFYNKFKRSDNIMNVDIITKFYTIIQKQLNWTKETARENTDTLTKIVIDHPFSISLYTFIMQKNINTCISLGSEICNYMLNQIETVKDFIILYNKKIQSNSKDLYINNPNLKTFGLTPHGEASELKNITKKLFNVSVGSVSKLESLAKKEKVCIVILNHIIKNPIEFNLWKLIDRDLAQEYIQSPDMGITQKTIDRFNTISFKPLKNGKKWNFDIDKYGSIDSDEFVILVNLNYELFRVYAIYNEMPVIGGGKKEIKINKHKISEFILYVKNGGIIKNHTRVSEYNMIQEHKILNNMFLPTKFDIDEIKSESQVIDSKFLRYEILTRIKETFDDIIKKEYKNGEKIKTLKDVGVIIHSPKIVDVFNSILIEQYDIHSIKNDGHSNQFQFSETFQTFLSTLFELNVDFRRLTHDYYIKANIDPKILAESPSSIKIHLGEKFKVIVDEVLKKIITDKKNIYQGLIFKNSLLKLSLY